MRGRITVMAVSLALAVLSLGGVAAQGATVSEGFTVSATLTVLNVPASVTYEKVGGGNLTAGMTSDVETFRPSVTSNGTVTLTINGSDFSGPSAIGQDAREIKLNNDFNWVTKPSIKGQWTNTSGIEAANPVGSYAQPSNGMFDVDLRVIVPAVVTPGAYTGSLELAFTAS